MDCCKDCRHVGTRVQDVRRLYEPSLMRSSLSSKMKGCSSNSCSSQQFVMPKCRKLDCNGGGSSSCPDRYKRYWSKNCPIPCINCYEEQPWLRDPLIQAGWGDFASDFVTPTNISCHLQPRPQDVQFKCHKVRALMGPQVACIWDLPCQEECCPTRYGYNRDWRRYNEDQRMKLSDVQCGCWDEPVCPRSKCEWPPYMGRMYGGRYMAWAHPLNFMFPRQ